MLNYVLLLVTCLGMLGCTTVPVAFKKEFEVIAHRGMHHDFSKEDLRWDTCTAKRIYPPKHDYIENTIRSIQAAFDKGATMVEIDVRLSKDNVLMVFHDFMLSCRTQAEGNVSSKTVKELKALDIGYGYTADGGKTFPLRGKGVGKMKTLQEVLEAFPDKRFLIDNKNWNDRETNKVLADTLQVLPRKQQKNIFVWTGDISYKFLQERVPLVKRLLLPKQAQKRFYLHYMLSFGLLGWDTSYENEGLGLPLKYANLLWGWPYGFLRNAQQHSTRFYLQINTKEEFKEVQSFPLDGIVTDHIEYYQEEKAKDLNGTMY